MNSRYQVIFLGLDKSQEFFKQAMTRLGVPSSLIVRIINNPPVILKQDLDLLHAENYGRLIRNAGGNIKIQEYTLKKKTKDQMSIEPLENFVMCPQCGHKQLKTETCVRCSLALES